jgi:hypothetical protein
LRTPTIALPVRLALQGDSATAAALFVPDLPRQARAQLLDDLAAVLDEDRDFVPVLFGERRVLVNRSAIAYVAVARRPLKGNGGGISDEDEISDVHTLYDHRCPVFVTLHDGTPLRGTLLFSSPADRARLVDFINLGPRFVRVWTGDELYLVQRSAIRTLCESTESLGA